TSLFSSRTSCNCLFRSRFFLQPLQHSGYDQRQAYRGIHKNFAKLPTFSRRHKLSPGNRLAVGTARKAAPVHRLRADAQSIVIALQRQVFPAPAVAQFDERTELLRPVTRNASAYGEDSEALLTEQSGGKVLQVFEGIEAEARLPLLIALAVGQGIIEAQFRIGERGHKYWNIFSIGGLENAAFLLPLRQMRSDGAF